MGIPDRVSTWTLLVVACLFISGLTSLFVSVEKAELQSLDYRHNCQSEDGRREHETLRERMQSEDGRREYESRERMQSEDGRREYETRERMQSEDGRKEYETRERMQKDHEDGGKSKQMEELERKQREELERKQKEREDEERQRKQKEHEDDERKKKRVEELERKIQELEEKKRKDEARQLASETYITQMNEIYKTYQEPRMEEFNHEKAKKTALDAYSVHMQGSGMSQEDLTSFDQDTRQKSKPYFIQNQRNCDNAVNTNDVAHDDALDRYRNMMVKDNLFLCAYGFDDVHKNISSQAVESYKTSATKAFPSYSANLRHLESALGTLKEQIDEQRTFGRKTLRFFRLDNLFKTKSIVIPPLLFKKKNM